jgi:hypothetical protein
MQLHDYLKRFSASTSTLLNEMLRTRRQWAASIAPLTARTRKLPPIDEVVARIGREPFAPD